MHLRWHFEGPCLRRWPRAARVVGVSLIVAWVHLLVFDALAPPPVVEPARAAAMVMHHIVLQPVATAMPTPSPATAAAVARTGSERSPRIVRSTAPTAPGVRLPPTAPAVRLPPTAPAVRLPPTAPAMPLSPPAAAEVPVAAMQAKPTAAASGVPTRLPPSAELAFVLRRGLQEGQARVSWQVNDASYSLTLQATLPSGRALEQRSQGGFDDAGVAPLRLADRHRGRDVRAANFQRDHGKVTFSGPRWELPLHAGTQDRLSWLVQLVGLAAGAGEGLRDGAELGMWVVGARGAASHWRFEVRGMQRLVHAEREVETLWLVREPAHPYDSRVEVWLDPQRGHWPLRLRQTQIPGGEPLDWLLQGEPGAAGTGG